MGKICVIGSLNMDLVIHTPRLPVIGETIIGNGFMTAPGGKGANQAVAAARLGGEVTMVGHIGEDVFGASLKENLLNNKVDVGNVKTVQGKPTGIAVIVVKDGNNFIILESGANFTINKKDVLDIEHIIKDSDLLLLQMEIPKEAIEKAVEIASKYNVRVLLNPAPALRMSDAFLSKIDILIPNESECELITGMPVRTVSDAAKAVDYLRDKGIKQVIVTLGSKGVIYNNGKHNIHRPVNEVGVVDTTAAGDSFTGALAVALTNGKAIDEAVDFANIAATITVTRKGAQTSFPTLEEVTTFKINE